MSEGGIQEADPDHDTTVEEVEQAIRDYLFDPDSERVTRRFKASWIDVGELSTNHIAAALKKLQSKGTVEKIGETGSSVTWRYLGDPPAEVDR